MRRGRRMGWVISAAFILTLRGVLRAESPPLEERQRLIPGENPYQRVSLALGQELLMLFPSATGYVVSVTDREVFFDLAEKDLLRRGMELQVYRPGELMIHPISKQVLGISEKNLGSLRVVEVREKYSRGLLAEEKTGTVPGDRVRVSARRLRALLHLTSEAPEFEMGSLAQALIGRGDESARFTMVDEPGWAPSLASLGMSLEAVLADPAALRRLGEKTAADMLLIVRVGRQEGLLLASLTVHSLRSGSMLAEFKEPWPMPVQSMVSTGASLASDGEYVVRELSGPAAAMVVGDFLGEGRLEILLSDGNSLVLYRWEAQGLVWKWDEAVEKGERIIALDAGDLGGNNRAEVLVTTARMGNVRTEVRGWIDGKFEKMGVAEGLYLRTARRPDGGRFMVGQNAGVDDVLTGRVEEYQFRHGTVEKIKTGVFPRSAGIFGSVQVDVAGRAMIFSLDNDGYLQSLSDDGSILWRSGRPYGGYPAPASARDIFGFGIVDDEEFEKKARAFQGRLLTEETTGGIRLIVPRNFTEFPLMFIRQRARGRGEIVVLEGASANLQEVRRSRAFDGYIADLGSCDTNGDGRSEVIFVINTSSSLLGELGKLVVWRY